MFTGDAAAGGARSGGAPIDVVAVDVSWQHELIEVFAQLVSINRNDVATDAVRGLMRDACRVRSWVDEFMAWASGVLDRAHGEGQSISGQAALQFASKMSTRSARSIARQGKVLNAVPEFREPLAKGDVTGEHLAALDRVGALLTDEQRAELLADPDGLVTDAKSLTAVEFGRELMHRAHEMMDDGGAATAVRQRDAMTASMSIDELSGMHRLVAEFDPETGQRVARRLERAVTRALAQQRDRRDGTRAQRARWHRANCLAAMICGTAAGNGDSTNDPANTNHNMPGNVTSPGEATGEPGTRRDDTRPATCHAPVRPPVGADVSVIIEYRELVGLAHEHRIATYGDGMPIAPSTLRRLLCDAAVIPAVLGSDGVALDVGRRERLVTVHQRRALALMYSKCAFAGCDVPFAQCVVHHVRPWERMGRSDLANLLPLCESHHHEVHEGGWRLAMDGDRTITIACPDGTVEWVIGFVRLHRRRQRHRGSG
jgi:HNH endonuclease